MRMNNNLYDFLNTPAFDAVRKLQENSALTAVRGLQASSAVTAALKMETTGTLTAVRELQSTLNAAKSSMGGATVAFEEYSRTVAPIAESIKAMNLAYAPIFEQTRAFDTLNIKGIVSGLQTSASAMSAISGLNLSGIASIIAALPKYDFLSDIVTDNFSVDVAEKLYESGEITQDDINEEITEIISKKQLSPKAEWDKIKKGKWFIAIKILIILITFVCSPVKEYVADKVRDSLGITEFWEELGLYDLIDSIFGDTEESIVSEAGAKATVDESKTGNISKQKREDLLAKIKEIRTFILSTPQDENTGNLLSYLSDLEKDVNGKKYGLVFEEHREEIDEVLDTHTTVLTEDKALFIDKGGQMNFLIEGDNLASLKLLEKTHKGKIDLIYIDPPYNTGSKDFIYDDTYVVKEDGYRHSKWLSFIRKRLLIAKSLLSNNGIIFISISDIEQANMRILCNEIFGEQNFVGNLVWANKEGGGSSDSKLFRIKHEYIVVYAKNIELIEIVGVRISNEARYKSSDEYEAIRGKYYLQKLGMGSIQYSSSLDYPIKTPDGSTVMPKDNNEGKKACWRWSYDKYKWGKDNGFIEIKKDSKGIWTVYTKQYLKCDNDGNIIVRTNRPMGIIDEFSSTQGAKVVRQIFGDAKFPYPKDVNLIIWLIERIANKNATILDFFAGSGTTGHAVMQLNGEDKGKRKFILCTNNENNICCDVTYERIKRVIDKEGYSASLKYYKVGYIPISERLYYEYADELLKHIRELVELENAINFTGNTEIAIVLTEEELNDFISHIDDNCKKLYLGHDILMNTRQTQILKDKKITINIIPDYYYKELEG